MTRFTSTLTKLASLVLVLITVLGFSQNQNSLLWKVSGNGLKNPSYVFGTYHMLCSKDFQIKDKVKTALNSSEQFMMEVNFSDPETMAVMQSSMMAKQKLSDVLSPKEVEVMKANISKFGYRFEDIENMSPMVINSLLMVKYFDCAPTELKMIDVELMNLAASGDKIIGGLETAKEQMETLGKFLTPSDLVKSVTKFEEGKGMMSNLKKAYLDENLAALDQLIKDRKEMTQEQEELLLNNRNKNWVKMMPQLMTDNSTFFAVGAGHLLGKEGVITLLQKQGYTIAPVN